MISSIHQKHSLYFIFILLVFANTDSLKRLWHQKSRSGVLAFSAVESSSNFDAKPGTYSTVPLVILDQSFHMKKINISPTIWLIICMSLHVILFYQHKHLLKPLKEWNRMSVDTEIETNINTNLHLCPFINDGSIQGSFRNYNWWTHYTKNLCAHWWIAAVAGTQSAQNLAAP